MGLRSRLFSWQENFGSMALASSMPVNISDDGQSIEGLSVKAWLQKHPDRSAKDPIASVNKLSLASYQYNIGRYMQLVQRGDSQGAFQWLAQTIEVDKVLKYIQRHLPDVDSLVDIAIESGGFPTTRAIDAYVTDKYVVDHEPFILAEEVSVYSGPRDDGMLHGHCYAYSQFVNLDDQWSIERAFTHYRKSARVIQCHPHKRDLSNLDHSIVRVTTPAIEPYLALRAFVKHGCKAHLEQAVQENI